MHGSLLLFGIVMIFPPLVSSLKLMNKKAGMEWRQRRNRRPVLEQLLAQPYRSHADGRVRPAALDGFVQGLAEHAA